MDNSAAMIATRCPGVRWVAVLSGLAALAGAPRGAQACFFYEGAEDVPVVDQTAMQVVLRQVPADEAHPDGQVEMILGVRTEGVVPDLGWIVPVPSYPTVDVEASFSFVSLDAATAPTFRTSSGTAYGASSSSAGCGGSRTLAGADEGPEDHTLVTEWDTTEAGPYVTTVLTAESLDALRTWASDNGFPWLPSTERDFQHYIDERWFFVASKLRPAEGTPSLVPLSLSWDGGQLVVPLMSSRRDATADMGLAVWVIADRPAVPNNWAQVAVPETQILASEEGTNYGDLVAETVEGAGGGQAFVTEYVQPTATTAFEINDEPTRALVDLPNGWVTRLYTRIDPEDVTSDPTFTLDASVAPVAQLHDLTLVDGSPYWGSAIRPISGLAPVGLFVVLRLVRRRRRRV